MSLFTVGYARGKRSEEGKSQGRHLLGEKMYQSRSRVAFRANLFTAPFDWHKLGEQLRKADDDEQHIALPRVGEVLASIVKIHA